MNKQQILDAINVLKDGGVGFHVSFVLPWAEEPEPEPALAHPYPAEILSEDEDDGTMPENVGELTDAVIGRKIVSVEFDKNDATTITLDDGRKVTLVNTDDCCAFTALETFLLHPDKVEHAITGVGTTDGYTRWHIYADAGDILELEVGWSPGNPFYYGYGFNILVSDPEEVQS